MCNNSEFEKLFKIGNMKILSPSFKNKDSYILSCKKCGHTFVDSDATQEDFNNYYRSDSAHALSYYECYGKEHTDNYFSDVLNKFKNFITKNSAIIDVASGVGDFSQFLIEHGYKNVTALDISERCCKLLKDKKIPFVLSDTIQFDKTLERKYDAAVLLHSLEHYLDFKAALEGVKKLVKPNGIIYVETPDAQRYCDVEAVPFTMFTYEHTFHLTQETMKNLGKVCGLNLLDTNSFYKADSYWVVYGLFKNTGIIENPVYTDTVKNGILKYICFSKNLLKQRLPKRDATKYYLWGIGASTALLLNETFDEYNVVGLIDRNPARQGIEYTIGTKKLKIQSPESIVDKDAAILVLPYWYKDSIVTQIQAMGLTNKILAL